MEAVKRETKKQKGSEHVYSLVDFFSQSRVSSRLNYSFALPHPFSPFPETAKPNEDFPPQKPMG